MQDLSFRELCIKDNKAYLLLGEMLAVGRAGGGADGVKRIDQSFRVALSESDPELDLAGGIRRTVVNVSRGNTLTGLEHSHATRVWLRQRQGEEGGEDEDLGNHDVEEDSADEATE